MDKILQQIGTFLGRKFSKIYTIFNDKYNELDNKKVDKEEGKELMPSPEGASDTVFLSETGWREVNTDKIRTHVISISIPFDSAWDFNGAQEITLEEGDYDRDEADSFIYDYFRYNNPNVVIRNTNTTAQSAQKGYHTVWKVALDTIAEGRALRLYLDIPENLSFTMAPEADSARFTRYCILLYLSQDEGNQTYILNNIGILPNGTDSFIPRKYLDGKLSDITSSYLPLSGGLMTGNIAFPDGKGLGSAVGQSDLLVRSGNTVKLGSAGFSARLYAENPVVREGLEGMFTMYDTSNLDIDKPFVTDLWAVYDAEGKNTQSIAVDLYNPVAKSATKVYMELLPVTDTNMGLMTPSYKTALDRLIPSSGESLSIYGTPASTWQLTLGTGPKLKNSGGIFELRDNSDNAYTDLILNNITIKGNVTQEGSSFITKAETVEVSDNILLLNRGEVGSGVTKGISGIQVDRGALADYQFIFDESDDRFKVGVEGDLWPVMLRNNESDLSDKFFLSWDASLKRAVTTNIVPETGLLFSGGVSNHPEYDITVVATGSGSIRFGALQANTPWSCTIGYNLNTRDVPSADILDFATSLNAYRYDKPSVLNMIYFDTYLSPNSIEPYGASSISLTTGSGDDLIHTKGGQNYIIYDSSNLDVEGLIQNYTLSGNIIGTPKTTRIKGTTIPSGSDFINNFRELIWGTNDSTTWIVPFRSNSADSGLGGAYAANLGWSLGDTHAYISVSYRNDLRSVIIGGGNEGKIKWFEQVAFKSDINKLSSKYYPYSGRGYMIIKEDGRPTFTNNQGILFNRTSGVVEGIYVTPNNHLNIGGSQSNNVPVDIYNKLNVNSISTTREQLGLLGYHPTDWTGVSNTQVGVGTPDSQLVLRSNSSDLLHYRDGVHCLIFDSYNFSRNLGTTSLNSSFNHFPMMAAQPSNSDATTDRGYPIQQAGSLIVIPGVYNGSSQIYGTYDSNRWFVRSGSPTLNNENEHTAWKELATTTHLSGYLPLTGGTLTGSLNIGDSSQNVYNYIRIRRNNYTFETTVSEGSGILSLDSSNSGVTPTMLKISPGGHAYINDEELATTSRLSNYLPLSGGVLSGSNRIVLRINSPSSVPAVDIVFSIGNSIKSSVGFELGTLGAFLSDNVSDKVFCLKNGPEIRTNSGTLIGKIPYKSDLDKYLPLSGGTLTGRLTVPRINTNYIESIDGNALLAYHQAGVDGVTNAQVGIGTVVDQMILRSSNTNLMHYKNGTQYTILDTSNIAALTIQFNGSTNTTYAPNAAKTVNITPAAIGAAAVGHTHNYAGSASAGGPANLVKDSGGRANPIQISYGGTALTSSTANFLAAWKKDLVNGNRELRDIPSSEALALIGAAPSSHTHVMSDISGLSLTWSSITGKPETATRWPSWSEVTNKPINPSYSFGGNNDSITTAQFLTHLQNLGAFSTGFGIYRGSWSYMANQSITDTGVGVIHLAGSTVEVIGNSASNCTIRVTVPTTSGNGTTKRIYVYCNNGDDYKPGWFAVARTDELTWNSISGKPSTFTPSSHTHTKSQITDFPSSMPASDVYAWAKASSKPSYSWSEITSKPSTFTPSSHTHPLSDISDLQASWDALLKAAPSAYVTRWPSWSEVTSKPSFATVATSGSYNDLSNKPSIPSAETAATIMSKINSQSEITFSKHVVCSAGAGTSSTSDIRFKNNITSLAPVLSHVLGSPGFFYTWKDEDEVLVGTSAQYWEGRITGLVREINDKSKTKTFSYERYTVILQEALKEEHMLREAEKEEYRKEICSLREELEDLKKLIQKLL
jgi:hypothetical protein|uniref:Tail fiber family protein n=1 Tax=CrAss-like virus sp. ctDAq1 TaxID=2826822 RepID=A0A8S5QU95_9CAUD|nr:MAG TPA: Tail fiber family protein [CrAss-like virus sp. ctDAq1]